MINKIDYYIKDHYGSKKGFKNLVLSKFQYALGYWNEYKNINWNKVDSFVFMCMGNICRSPLGEATAKQLGANSRSCGLTAPLGDPADPRAIAFGKELELNLELHRTTPIADANFTDSDLIIAMEPQHFSHINFPSSIPAQKTLIGLWHPNNTPYLHDPYNTSKFYFNKCEHFVVEATTNIIEFHKNQKK